MKKIGEISIGDIENKYNLGFWYAESVIEKLEEIGYIKKKSGYVYLYEIIQTEEEIDKYVKSHVEELRPQKYKDFGWKDNGEQTIRARMEMNIAYYKAVIPIFVSRILFSIPGAIIYLLMSPIAWVIAKNSELSGESVNFVQSLIIFSILSVLFYIFILIPSNLIIRIIQASIYKMKFKDFMLLPRNWFFKRCKDSYAIQKLLFNNNVKFYIGTYDNVMNQLRKILNEKKSLAEHYANIANNAINENEFYQSINSCISTLEWMAQFEKFDVFTQGNTPSDDIRIIKDGMDISIKRFQKRMDDIQKKVFCDYDNMEGHDFEYFCADILKKNGFENVEVTQGSGDHGIDILAEKDGITYAIQCKRYDKPVNNSAIQQAIAGKGIYKKDIAVVLTNNRFTPQAKEEAAALGVKLWDRDKLNKLCSIIQNESNINVIYHKEKAKKSIPADVINLSEKDSRIIFEFLKSKSLHYIESYLKIKESNNYQNEEKMNVEPPITLYNAQIHFKLNTIEYVFYSKVNPEFYKTSAYRNVHKDKNVDIFQIDVYYDLDSVSYDGRNVIISSEPEVTVLGTEFETMELLEEIDDWKTEEEYLTEQSFYLKKSNYKSM